MEDMSDWRDANIVPILTKKKVIDSKQDTTDQYH